jgi:lactate permease
MYTLPILAISPIIIFFSLMVFLRRSVFISAFFSFITTVAIGLFVWKMEEGRILSAMGKGLFISTEIILIIFGALLILEILRKKDLFVFLKSIFEWVSRDERVHVLLIGWGLVFFLEGVAGFGTPALIAVPLFIALGFSSLTAVTIALMGNTIPVAFGAIGLPFIYGIGSVLEIIPGTENLLGQISLMITNLNIIGSLIVPIVLLLVFCILEKKPLSHIREMIPFALAIGLITAVASIGTLVLIGPELVSVIGGFFAIGAISFMARKKILLPRSNPNENLPLAPNIFHHKKRVIMATLPYIILLSFLILTRLPFFPFRNLLTSFGTIKVPELFSFPINYSFHVFYSAGILILLSAVISVFFLNLKKDKLYEVLVTVTRKIWMPYMALTTVLMFVYIFIYSGDNTLGIASMPIVLARSVSDFLGPLWPMIAPFVGALGAFTSGSATVSNLIFTGFQYETALASNFSPVLILSLQAIGAAAGNMIAPHNIIAALTVAEVVGKERIIIKRNIVFLIPYLLIIGSVGLILSEWIFGR